MLQCVLFLQFTYIYYSSLLITQHSLLIKPTLWTCWLNNAVESLMLFAPYLCCTMTHSPMTHPFSHIYSGVDTLYSPVLISTSYSVPLHAYWVPWVWPSPQGRGLKDTSHVTFDLVHIALASKLCDQRSFMADGLHHAEKQTGWSNICSA
jgi:hypothetical protein